MKKYRRTANYSDKNDDLYSAIEYNYDGLQGFSEAEIESIIVEVCGENDNCDWFWVVKLDNKKYVALQGGCDYTGWDCQSNLKTLGICNTIKKAINLTPELDNYDRPIRKTLHKQRLGRQAFGTITLKE